jgi:hypothetical protein
MNNNILYTIYTNFFNIKIITTTDNILLTSSKYDKHLIGIYDSSLNIWYNAWSLHNYNPAEIKLSKTLLKYLLENENNNKHNNMNDNIIKSFIFNSKIYILEEIQLKLIVAIFVFYTKLENYHRKKINNLFFYYGFKNNMII